MRGKISLCDEDRCFVATCETDLECSMQDEDAFIALVKTLGEEPFNILRPEEDKIVLETSRISASFRCENPGRDHYQAAALARGEDVPWKETPANFKQAITSCAISVHPDEGSFGPFGALHISGDEMLSCDRERASRCSLQGGMEPPIAIPLSRIPYMGKFWAPDGSNSTICFSGEWLMQHTGQEWHSVRCQGLDPDLAEYTPFPHRVVRDLFEKERQNPIFLKLPYGMAEALKRALPVKKDEPDIIEVAIDRHSLLIHRGRYHQKLPIENGPEVPVSFMINHRHFLDAVRHEEIRTERSCEIDLETEVMIFKCGIFQHIIRIRSLET